MDRDTLTGPVPIDVGAVHKGKGTGKGKGKGKGKDKNKEKDKERDPAKVTASETSRHSRKTRTIWV